MEAEKGREEGRGRSKFTVESTGYLTTQMLEDEKSQFAAMIIFRGRRERGCPNSRKPSRLAVRARSISSLFLNTCWIRRDQPLIA